MPYKDNEKKREYAKKYRERNTVIRKYDAAKYSEYREANKVKIAERMKAYYQANKDKLITTKNKEASANFYSKNKQTILNKRKERLKTDPIYKTKENIRTAIYQSFNNKGIKKNGKTEQILGCTFAQFKEHLEIQFESWMNWDNKGKYKKDTYNYGWDVDHIIPLDTALTEADIVRLNHYTNLRPLCSKVNRDIKRAKLL